MPRVTKRLPPVDDMAVLYHKALGNVMNSSGDLFVNGTSGGYQLRKGIAYVSRDQAFDAVSYGWKVCGFSIKGAVRVERQ